MQLSLQELARRQLRGFPRGSLLRGRHSWIWLFDGRDRCLVLLCWGCRRILASTKSTEDPHRGSCSISTVRVEFIARRQQLTICVQDIGQGDRSCTVSLLRQIPRFFQGLHLLLKLDHVDHGLTQLNEGVLHIFCGPKDGLSINGQSFACIRPNSSLLAFPGSCKSRSNERFRST